ncbi:TonB-dependent receptor family protein, partial [Hyphomonas sp.]|uniref:TonB-dependent receptor family protein n=1 Tax=Hyphomonas sp. TaxID=87 RepID=UPI003918F544
PRARPPTTLGGVIETHSKTGLTHPGAGISYSAGSFGYQRGSAEIGGAMGRFDAFAAITASEADGYRDQSATETLRVSANAGLRLSDRIETRLFAALVETDALWPGTLTRAEFLADPGAAALVSVRRNQKSDIDQKFLSSRTVLDMGPGLVTVTAGWNDRFKNHPTPGGILLEDSETLSAGLLWTSAPGMGPWLTEAGLRYATMDQDATTFAYAGGLNSPVSAQPGAVASDRVREASNTEAYVRLGYQASPALLLSGSLAYLSTDRAERRGPLDPTTSPAYDISYDAWLPGAGLVWRVADSWSVFASLTRTAEAPSFFDLGGNQPLQPDRIPRLRMQTADTAEIGSRGRYGALRWDATLYHGRLKGELLRLDAAGALNPPILNADKTLRTGFELAGEADLTDSLFPGGPSLALAGKYDWLWARFDDDPVYGNNRVAGVPEHSAYAEARFGFGPNFTLTPNLTWRGSTRTDLFNTISAEAAVLIGLNATVEVGNVRLWVEGRNLTDERWVSAVNVVNQAGPGSGLYFPGDAASVYAGISLRR